jgi:hypothetical protein
MSAADLQDLIARDALTRTGELLPARDQRRPTKPCGVKTNLASTRGRCSDLGMQDLEADSEDSWPEVMLNALSDRADDLAAYQAKRAKIDRAAEHDVTLRIDRPNNPFQKTWDDVLKISKNAVAGSRLLGFHATRLIPGP